MSAWLLVLVNRIAISRGSREFVHFTHRRLFACLFAFTYGGSGVLAQPSLQPITQPAILPEFNLPFFNGGAAQSVTVVDHYAYVPIELGGLAVLDIANPANPICAGGFTLSGSAVHVQVVGPYAYVADGSAGLQVLDVSNPARIVRKGGYDSPGSARRVQVVGSLAYLADSNAGVHVLDVSNPTNVVRVGGFARTNTFWRAHDVQIVGPRAYVAASTTSLTNQAIQHSSVEIFDLSSPTDLVPLGSYQTIPSIGIVRVSGTYAFTSLGNSGFQVLDVSSPTNIILVSSISGTGRVWDIHLAGARAYVARSPELEVYDVSNPTNMVRLGRRPTGYALGVQVVGNSAYVANGPAGLHVLDVSNPANLVPLGDYDTFLLTEAVDVAGRYAYVADSITGLQVFDVSNPSAPLRVSSPQPNGEPLSVQVVGNRAYTAGFDGVQVFDVGNPTNLVKLGAFNYNGPPPHDIWIEEPYAYVAGGSGFEILRVSNANNIVSMDTYSTASYALAVHVANGRGYVGTAYDGLLVLSVSDPANISLLGAYTNSTLVEDVQVVGHHAFVAAGKDGLLILDVNNPAAPTLLGSYTNGYAAGVSVSGPYAFVASWLDGVQALDVSNPGMIVCVASYDTPGTAQSVFAAPNGIYVANRTGGLAVLPSLANALFTMRADMTPGIPFTIEATTNLNDALSWIPLFFTNSSQSSVLFTDWMAREPQKFYRARQP